MTGGVLRIPVLVRDDDYSVVVLPAGQPVPEKYQDRITNPIAFEAPATDADTGADATAAAAAEADAKAAADAAAAAAAAEATAEAAKAASAK